MNILIAAIHGILTGQTDASWPDRFDAWAFRHFARARVIKKEYAAGPFPRWNCRQLNPRHAHALANELELFGGDPSATDRTDLWFVAHSNGAAIALETARLLIDRGRVVTGLILTGAACEADIARNGLLDWALAGRLHAAIAGCCRQDRVLGGPVPALRRLWGRLIAPYGQLGITGWQLRGRPITENESWGTTFRTRWIQGGHSAWFAPEQLETTFAQIRDDIAAVSVAD